MNRLKEEKGSLALFVTIAMLFFMAFLLVLYVSTANEQKTQLEITSRIKQTYEKDLEKQDEVYTGLLGTSEYIPIYTAEQFKKIGSGESVYVAETGKNYRFNMDSKYQLKNNIDLNKGKYTINNDDTITFSNTAEQWIPIGTEQNQFTGELDGNGYKISGLYKNSGSNFGLFGYNDGTVKNLVLDNGYIELTGDYSSTFVSRNLSNGLIENCTNRIDNLNFGKVSGGICARNEGIVRNSVNEGNIEAGQRNGGICSQNAGTIIYCKNYGNINSTSNGDKRIGGVVGSSSGIIENSFNAGKIILGENSTIAGGIVGTTTGIIKNCCNTGNIEANEKIGGIVGLVENSAAVVTIDNCYNSGELKSYYTSRGIVGGIVGWLYTGNVTINNSYNIGKLNLANVVESGALVGHSTRCTLSNCYYLKGTATSATNGTTHEGATESEAAYMKSAEFENILNENGTKTNWKRVLGKNNGYPVLTVFNDDAGSNFNTLND